MNYYYLNSFDFCTADEDSSPVENLGQVVFGERIRPSPYQVSLQIQQSPCVLTLNVEFTTSHKRALILISYLLIFVDDF